MRSGRFSWLLFFAMNLVWILPSAQSLAQDSDSVSMSVVAEGVGTSQEEALEMAFQSAVSDAVGALVTAQTLIDNGELVQDKIISHSGGFVEDYEVLEGPRSTDGGKIYMKIKASVSQTRLVSTLRENRVTVNEVSGETLAAQSFSIDLSRRTGAEAWEALWNDFLPPSKIYVAQLKSYKLLEAGDRSRVSFVYTIKADTAYFFDQVVTAISKVAKETCVFEVSDPFVIKFDNSTYGPDKGKTLFYRFWDFGMDHDYVDRMKFVQEVYKRVPLEYARKWKHGYANKTSRENIVLLNERMDRASLWRGYVLEAQVMEAIGQLYSRDIGRTAVRFRFLDDASNEVAPEQYDLRFMASRQRPFGLGPGFVVNYTTGFDVNYVQAIGISPFIASELAVSWHADPTGYKTLGLASEMEYVAELDFDTDLLQAVSKVSVEVIELSEGELTALTGRGRNSAGFRSAPRVVED